MLLGGVLWRGVGELLKAGVVALVLLGFGG